jgi:DNA-3-methyladenine glycosylase
MVAANDPLPRSFYARSTLTVAPQLLGKILVRSTSNGRMTGRIVEVEAYRGADDPASHSYRGKTRRNSVMFGEPGIAYVYFTYGNHHCLNFVTEKEGIPAAVLIRAVEPLEGIEAMKTNRGVDKLTALASGPGKLTKAFQITRAENGCNLTDSEAGLTVHEPREKKRFEIIQTARIGIRVALDKSWRFYIQGNPHVSKRGTVRPNRSGA